MSNKATPAHTPTVRRFPAVPCAYILECEDINDIQLTDIEKCVAATDYDRLLSERDALLATAAKLRELIHGAMALIEGGTLLTEVNCDDWMRRARNALLSTTP